MDGKDTLLKILFWNPRSIKPRKNELGHILQEIDILVCVESWLKPKDNFKIAGFNTYRKDREDTQGGGILFLIRKDIKFSVIVQIPTHVPDIEMGGIRLTNFEPTLDLMACYKIPGSTLEQHEWNAIAGSTDNNNTILMGDFNAHNQLWNCRHTDSNGERLYNSMTDNDLFLHNHNTLTHVNARTNFKSNIDLVFSTISLADKIDVKVYDETFASDHYPILLHVDARKHAYHKQSYRLKSLKTDWEKFENELTEYYSNFFKNEYDTLAPSKKYDFFVDVITKSIKAATPPKKNYNHKKRTSNPVPWWDPECNKIKRLRRESYKKWEFSNNLEDLIDYNKNCALAKLTFKKKKIEYHKNFAKSINFRTSQKRVWNTFKILKNSSIKIKYPTVEDDYNEKARSCLDKIAPPWVGVDADYIPSCDNNEFFDVQFSFSELNIALSSGKKNSSPGIDGIDYEILRALPIQYKLLLLDIFNEMFQESDFPTIWTESIVHFVDKPDGIGLRPITLTPCLSKLFERMVKNRLEYWVEINNIIPTNQSGFRKGRSCTDNLTNLTLEIQEALAKKEDLLAAFLDVSGAFNNVLSDILLNKLAEIKCSIKMIRYAKFLTRERWIHTHIEGRELIKVNKGVPQGGVLSPLFYLLYVAKIAENVPKSVTISQFADDTAIYSRIVPFENCKSIVEEAVKVVQQNLYKLGLELSPAKTNLIHFNNKNILPGETVIHIDNCEIKSKDNVRFLGLVFDYKLTFANHVNMILSRCNSAINIMKYLCGTWWGSDPETLIILYKSFVRSLMEYGIFLYFPKTKQYAKKIERIQYNAIRVALGYRRSTPTNVILAESKLTLIQERAKYLGNKYFGKILSNKSSLIYDKLMYVTELSKKNDRKRILNQCIKNMTTLADSIDTQCKYSMFLHDFQTTITSIPINTNLGEKLTKDHSPNLAIKNFVEKNDILDIYTDGSKIPGSKNVGSACVVPKLNLELGKSINSYASIYTAECIALYEATEIALQHDNRNIAIFSDSLSALESLKSSITGIHTNPFILKIKSNYIQFKKKNPQNELYFYWIPSHVGIEGNERADIVAKRATEKNFSNYSRVPYSDILATAKKTAFANTDLVNKEQAQKKGKEYFKKYRTENVKPWFHKSSLPREYIVTINRCRADHYNLASSLFRVNIVSSPKCECGYDSQDLNHILWNCPILDTQRTMLMTRLKKEKMFPPFTIKSFLATLNANLLQFICDYFKDCQLNI